MSNSSSDRSSSSDEGLENDETIPVTKLKFYTSDEVVIHNNVHDIWVIVNKIVFSLTPIFKEAPQPLNAIMQYLLAFGGKDLSSFFDDLGEPRTQVSCISGEKVPIFPPAIIKAPEDDKFWWENSKYQMGRLTRKERPIRIVNTLTSITHKVVVCDEDTIYDIQLKYRNLYNHHVGSYLLWKHIGRKATSGRLFLNKTLTANGIYPTKNGIGPPPAIFLFYMDDLTIG